MSASDTVVTFLSILGVAAMVAFVLYAIRLEKRRQAKRMAQIKQFAESAGYTYALEVAPESPEIGSLPKMSKATKLTSVVSGAIAKFPVRFFGYTYRVRQGKSSYDVTVTVTAVDLPHHMPHMVIDSHIDDGFSGSVLPLTFNKSQKIELEGDFYKYFSVYAPDTRELDALIILAPDVMLVLLQLGARCDIEFIDKRLYIYHPGMTHDIAAYQDSLKTVAALLEELGAKLRRFDKASAIVNRASIEAQPDSGQYKSRLKKKRFTGSLATIALVVLGFGLVFFPANLNLPEIIGPLFVVVLLLTFLWALIGALGGRKSKLKKELAERYGEEVLRK
jgi:hypothetical protein